MKDLGEISRGGFGVVHKVELNDSSIGACKTFSPKNPELDNDKMRRRFRREVKVQSRLPANAAIPVLRMELDSDPPYYVMAFAERSLREQINNDRKLGKISPEPLDHLFDALEVLHDLDYAHRDLKPDNVLFENGRWKLADFGLVLPLTDDTETLTEKSAYGSQYYMAPEQARDFHFVDPRADIYSVGCILHDWVVGTLRTPMARQTCPGPLKAVVEKCTAPLEERYNNIAEVRVDVFAALAKPGVVAKDPEAADFVARLGDEKEWNREELIALIRYLQHGCDSGDARAIFDALSKGVLARLHDADTSAWPKLAFWYCRCAAEFGFPFEQCDVIVGELKVIYKSDKLSLQSAAAIAAARLAAEHNRWFVMRRVVEMAGQTINSKLAERLAVDIDAQGHASKFIRCAEETSQDPQSVYHPLVAEVLR